MSFKLSAGVEVPDLAGISEGYELSLNKNYTVIKLNISRENLEETFIRLSSLVRAPSFFILEHPTHRDKEMELRTSPNDPLHKDVNYIDGLDIDGLKKIWKLCSEFCLDDGATTFGYGSHEGYDEVFVARYKITYIYTDTPSKYIEILEQLKFPRVKRLKTVWDNFSEEKPGNTIALEIGGKRIYEIVEALKAHGLYFADHRED